MTATSAEEYYKAHQNEEKEYVRIWVAREVKSGDRITINSALGVDAVVSAPEDGYEIKDHAGTSEFLTKAEFKEQAVPADDFELPLPKEDLTEEELKLLNPVKKGDEIVVNPGITIITRAERDGFILSSEEGGNSIFISNFELTSEFNYAGRKFETEKELIVTDKLDPPVKGIILTEDVIFAFKAGEYNAPAGSLLFINSKDEDGYTVDDRIKSPNASLRVTSTAADAKAQREALAEKQQRVKAQAQTLKIKK